MWRMVRTALVTAVLVAGFALTPVGALSHAQAGTTFSLGSLPSAVLAAMGEPGRRGTGGLEDQTWYYGGSWVAFVEGRVREYANSGNLKVSLGAKSSKLFFVWVGCHRVTVIAALGTPTSVTRTTLTGAIWGYGRSSLTMRNDKVVGWTDKGELKGHVKGVTVVRTPSSSLLTPLPPYDTPNVTVYVTRTGSKYHRYGCRYLRQSCIAVYRSSAITQGYGPCSVCNPP
jgi:hypothetical protein